jgi:hypothetical protein
MSHPARFACTEMISQGSSLSKVETSGLYPWSFDSCLFNVLSQGGKWIPQRSAACQEKSTPSSGGSPPTVLHHFNLMNPSTTDTRNDWLCGLYEPPRNVSSRMGLRFAHLLVRAMQCRN